MYNKNVGCQKFRENLFIIFLGAYKYQRLNLNIFKTIYKLLINIAIIDMI